MSAGVLMAMSIVLVHGGSSTGRAGRPSTSCGKAEGYNVIVVQNPTLSLADDVASQPKAVATLIKNAARELASKSK